MSETETRGAGPEVATLGGGCFWCLEAVFDELEGVLDVVSGYAGGQVPDPTYEAVCSGTTGHAEVVQVTFDPQRISYRDLLEVFFSIHDPTTLNRQGMDVGTQYRSAIYFHSPQQEQVAREVIADLERQRLWNAPLVTEVTPLAGRLLPGGGVPPGVLRPQSLPGLLLDGRPPQGGQVPQAAPQPVEEALRVAAPGGVRAGSRPPGAHPNVARHQSAGLKRPASC